MDKDYVSKTDTLVVKAVAILLMIYHHAFAFPERIAGGAGYQSLYVLEDGQPVEQLIGHYGKLCVALFMLLSGFGMYRSYMNRKNTQGEVNLTPMITKRIKTVYIKWWQSLVVFAPICVVMGAAIVPGDLIGWVKNIFAIDSSIYPEAWFLCPYLIMMCMFPLVVRWFERKHANPWIDLILIAALNTLVFSFIVPYVSKNEYLADFGGSFFYQKMILVFAMLPMFMTGCLLAKYDIIRRIRECFDYGYVAKIVGVLMIVVTFIIREKMHIPVPVWGWDTFDFLYAAVVSMGVLFILEGLNIVKKGMAFVGKQATWIWLIHTYLCYYCFQDFFYSPKNTLLIYLFLTVVSVVIAWLLGLVYGLIWKYVKRFVIKAD